MTSCRVSYGEAGERMLGDDPARHDLARRLVAQAGPMPKDLTERVVPGRGRRHLRGRRPACQHLVEHAIDEAGTISKDLAG